MVEYNEFDQKIIDGLRAEFFSLENKKTVTYDELLHSDYIMQAHDLWLGIQLLLDTYIPNIDSMSVNELTGRIITHGTLIFQAYPEIEVMNGLYLSDGEESDYDFTIRFPMTDSNTPHQAMWEFDYKDGKLSHGPSGVISMDAREQISVLYADLGVEDYPDTNHVRKLIEQKGGTIKEVKECPRGRHITRIKFEYGGVIYNLYHLLQYLAPEGDVISEIIVTENHVGFLQASQWFSNPNRNIFSDTRTLKIMFANSGSGSVTTRLSIPKSWVDGLDITAESREVTASFDGKKITIVKKDN